MATGGTSTATQGPPPKDDGDDGGKENKKEDPHKFKNKTPSPRKKGKTRQGRKGANPTQILDNERTGESIIAAVKEEARLAFQRKGWPPHGRLFTEHVLRGVYLQLERHWNFTDTEAVQWIERRCKNRKARRERGETMEEDRPAPQAINLPE